MTLRSEHLARHLALGSVGLVLCLVAGCSQASPAEAVGRMSASVTWEQCASFGNNNAGNDKTTFEYFVSKGLSAVQAAAIVGTFDGECANNPASKEGTNRGIAQWQVGGRWDTGGVDSKDNVLSFAKSQGRTGEEATLALQLDFVWWELSTYPAFGLAKLRQTTTVAEATSAFLTYYEGGGSEGADGPHVCWATFAYQTFGSGTGASDPEAGGLSAAGGSGGRARAMGMGGAAAAGGVASGNAGTTGAGAAAGAQDQGAAESEAANDGCSIRAGTGMRSCGWVAPVGAGLLALLLRKRRSRRTVP